MKISNIKITNFKRFTDLTINNVPQSAKVVLVVGPNGSGKTSLFDGFLHWYRFAMRRTLGTHDYYAKKGAPDSSIRDAVIIRFHDLSKYDEISIQGKFYFRTAYRNEAEFTITSLSQQEDPTRSLTFQNFIQNDVSVSKNYERLVSLTLRGVYDEANDNKSVVQLRDELIGAIRKSLVNVFDDLNLSSIGDPLKNGSFYFEKGTSKDFHYKNLSGGEKSAFDLLLDLIIKASYFQNAIYCIDEPETHMHTRLQARLFEEIYRLIPDQSQLWINTHSLGMLKRARDIEKANPGTIAFLNFDNKDFDTPVNIQPSGIDKTIWDKFIEITLDDLSNLVAPQKIIFCEGNPNGRKYKDFDAQIFTLIFSSTYPDVSFISAGSASELEKEENPTFKVVQSILKGSEIIKVIDRDDRNTQEVVELKKKGIRVLTLRHIESYLLHDEILHKLCLATDNPDKIDAVFAIRAEAIKKSVARGNAPDDIKSASADIYTELKKLLNLTQCGNTKEAFFRDTICPLITGDTYAFKALHADIFN